MHREQVSMRAVEAAGELALPSDATGLVVVARRSGGAGADRRDTFVAETLHGYGLATLSLELPGAAESARSRTAAGVDLLAMRIDAALAWADRHAATAQLPLGVLGTGAGAAAALRSAARCGARICAVVSRGGRPDLAGAATLARVDAPTLLIVGGDDTALLALNRDALRLLRGARRLEVVPGASSRFAEPGALDAAAHLAGTWFANHLRLRRAA